jgi:hypothetical protein
MLLLAVNMMDSGDSWQVGFVRWADFLKIMVEHEKNPSWGLLWDHTDLIIGGLNFEADIL